MAKGDRFPSERKSLRDPRTGASILQLTDHPSINHNLYFLNPSCTPDGKKIIFTSYRTGEPNLFMADEETGQIVQLTQLDDMNPYSAVPANDNRRLFFSTREEVRAVDLETFDEEVLASFPGCRVGNCNLSGDGSLIVTVVRSEGKNEIAVVETDGSGARVVFETERAVGHVQFCRAEGNLILYSSDITQRMWLVRLDGTENRPLYLHDENEWITHESWLGQSYEVMFVHWPYALKGIDVRTEEVRIISDFNCWHPSSRPDGSLIVCDTVHPDIGLRLIDPKTGEHRPLCYPGSSCRGRQWTKTVPARGKVDEGTYGPQWTHPHPSFSPDGRKVIYTSDRTGHPQVYLVYLEGV